MTSGYGPDEATCVRCGVAAAKAARSAPLGQRSREDVQKLIRLIQSRGCFFSSFSAEGLEDVCQSLEYRPMLAKKAVFVEGTRASYVYLVATGRVSLKDTHRSTKVCVLASDEDGGGESHVDVEPNSGRAGKSRGVRKRNALNGGLTTHEEKQEQTKVGGSKLTAVQRFRGAVASIKASRAAAAGQEAESRASSFNVLPSLKLKGEAPKPSWVLPPEPGSPIVPMKGSGRLGVSLSSVLQELATRCPHVDVQKKTEPFNSDLQKFNERVDAKMVSVLGKLSHVDSKEAFVPFVDDNPMNLCIDRKLLQQFHMRKPDPVERPVTPPVEQSVDKQQLDAVARADPTLSTVRAGHTFGIHAGMFAQPYDSSAKALERCELLAMSVQKFLSLVEKERRRRHAKREQALLSAVPSIRGLGPEKMDRLTECIRSSTHRRGTVLCFEGETRLPGDEGDHVQFIVQGCAHTYKARIETPHSPSHSSAAKRSTSPVMREWGTLMPGQVINGASQLLGLAEPLTVIADSAEVVVMNAAHADLARLGGSSLLESLRISVQELHSWREQRLLSQEELHRQKNAENGAGPRSNQQGEEGLMLDDLDAEQYISNTHERLSTWIAEEKSQSPPTNLSQVSSTTFGVAANEQDHDGYSRQEILRGGPDFQGKRTFPVAPPKCGLALVASMASLVRGNQEQEPQSWEFDGKDSSQSSLRLQESTLSTSMADTRHHRSLSIADGIWGPSSSGDADNSFLQGNDLPDNHFQCAPRLTGLVSQLCNDEQVMRIPKLQCRDRLEMRCAQGHIMKCGPIDPLHIATLRSDRGQGSAEYRRIATAPTQLLRAALRTPLCQESPVKPSTAPLPGISFLPNQVKWPQPRRWIQRNTSRGRTSASADSGEFERQVTPSDAEGRPTNRTLMDTALTERSDGDLALLDEAQRPCSPGRPCFPALDFTMLPASVGSHLDRGRSFGSNAENTLASGRRTAGAPEVEDRLFGASLEGSSSLFGGNSMDAAQTGSIDASSVNDPLLAGLSLGDLSTMLDENSIWERMWSVIGDGPTDSVLLSQDSLAATSAARPVVKMYGRRGSYGLSQALLRPGPTVSNVETTGLTGAHRPLRRKSREVAAKIALRDFNPLHINGVDVDDVDPGPWKRGANQLNYESGYISEHS